jgi:hypothetical protein
MDQESAMSSMGSSTRVGGHASTIVDVLRRFGRGKPVPIELVARYVGAFDADALADSLKEMSAKQIVEVDASNETVQLK